MSGQGDLYKRYKIGTKTVAEWLVRTASQHCELAKILPQLHRPSMGIDSQRTSLTAHPKIVLSTQDLLRLTEHVTNRETFSKLNRHGVKDIINILDDVIKGRRECALWYAQKAVSDHDQRSKQVSDIGHEHFASALQKVRNLLQTVCEEEEKNTAIGKKDKNSKKGKKSKKGQAGKNNQQGHAGVANGNAFSFLDVEQITIPMPYEELKIVPSGTGNEPERPVAVSLDDGNSEKSFALWCFLKDCQVLRKFTKDTWREFYDCKLSMVVANQASQNAFMLLSHAADSFVDEYPDLKDSNKIADFLELRLEASEGNIESFKCRDTILTSIQGHSAGTLELVCVPALTMTHFMQRCLEELEVVTVESYGIYDHMQACHPFGRILLSTWLELMELSHDHERVVDLAGSDLFVSLLMKFMSNPSAPSLEFIMVLQAHMDILELQNVGSFYEWYDLRLCYADRVANGYLEHFSMEAEKSGLLPLLQMDKKALKNHEVVKRWVNQGVVMPIIEWMQLKPLGDAKESDLNCSRLFAAFPMLCGHMATQISLLMHVDGVSMCNRGLYVICLAHLYVACVRSGRLNRRWPDMDFVIAKQKLGIRGSLDDRTVSPTTAAKQFGIAMGNPLSAYAHPRGKLNSRGLVRVPLPDIKKTLTDQKSQLRIQSPFWKAMADSVDGDIELGFATKTGTMAALSRAAHQAAIRNVQTNHPASQHQDKSAVDPRSPLKLLDLAKQALREDDLDLHFDYHQISMQSATMIRIFDRECGHQINLRRQQHGLPPTLEAPVLVDKILWDAADWESKPAHARPADCHIDEVARVLEGFIEMGRLNGKLSESHQRPPPEKSDNMTEYPWVAGMKLSMRGREINTVDPHLSPEERNARQRKADIVERHMSNLNA